jgi:hypothetical protein
MGHYQSSTPKRHWGAGNSTLISRLDKGVLQGWKKKMGGPTPVVKYIDSKGVKRYKGTADLRKTEKLSPFHWCPNFGFHFKRLWLYDP